MKKLTVLIVHNSYMLSGGEDAVVKNEISLLKRHGYRVLFYHRDNNEIKKFSFFKKLSIPFSMFFSLKTYCEIIKIIVKEKVDIIHVHNTLNLIGPAVYYAARKCRIPVVQTVHNFRLLCPNGILFRDGRVCEECIERGLYRSVIHGCYRDNRLQTIIYVICQKIHQLIGIYEKINYICLTDFNAGILKNFKAVSLDRLYIKGNFVDESSFFLNLDNRKNQYVFVGRIEKLKGIEFLLKGWKIYQKSNPASELLLLGEGPLEAWCSEYIKTKSLNVNMLGYVGHDCVMKCIAESRAFLFTTQCYEGLPVSVLEAFSVGTPVVCADFGNAGSLVTDGKTGAKYHKESIGSFVDAIRRVDHNYKEMISACYDEYKKKYDPEANIKVLEEIYGSIIKKEYNSQ